MNRIRTIDMFCGAGGSSLGARNAGAKVVAGFDKWPVACDAYRLNFPDARIYENGLEELEAADLAKELGEVNLILASPECRAHSPAKGKQSGSNISRDTAFHVIRFARTFKPRWIIIENVVSMRKWARYKEYVGEIEKIGYSVSAQALVATDFGVPQNRRRLFLLGDLKRKPNDVARTTKCSLCAQDVIDQNGRYRFSPLRTERRAAATIERAERAIASLGEKVPFLIVYYGSDHAGGWQRVDDPLRTITTVDRFAYVRPSNHGHEMRMLQPPELKAAMGMPPAFSLGDGTRRSRIKLVGNAVCPPVMESIVRSLTGGCAQVGNNC